MLRTSTAADGYRSRVAVPVSRTLASVGVRPSQVSFGAVGVAAVSALAFVIEPAVGGFLYLLSGALDTLDGAVARARGTATRGGAFLDSMLDRYAELLVLLGILGFYARADWLTASSSFWLFLAAFGSWMVSYAQARAEGLGSSCSFGFFERPERVVFVSGAAIASPIVGASSVLGPRPILSAGVIVLAVGTNVTALARLARGFAKMSEEDYDGRVHGEVKAYLEKSFPAHDVTHEWDATARSLVFRVIGAAKTMLLEFPAEALDGPEGEPWGERLERARLPEELREHLRLRVTTSGLEPLPWRQLASTGEPVDEQLRESFPASDPAPHSSVT